GSAGRGRSFKSGSDRFEAEGVRILNLDPGGVHGLGLVIGNHQVHGGIDGQLDGALAFIDPLRGAVELVLRLLGDRGGLVLAVLGALVLVRLRAGAETEEQPRHRGKGAKDENRANEAGAEGSCLGLSVCHGQVLSRTDSGRRGSLSGKRVALGRRQRKSGPIEPPMPRKGKKSWSD